MHLGDSHGEPAAESVPSAVGKRRGEPREWSWVREWRQSQEPVAWGPGIVIAVFVALVVALAIVVLTSGLAESPLIALATNIAIAVGMAPALWLSREVPVLRFLAGGAAVGIVLGWLWMWLTPPSDGAVAAPAPVVSTAIHQDGVR